MSNNEHIINSDYNNYLQSFKADYNKEIITCEENLIKGDNGLYKLLTILLLRSNKYKENIADKSNKINIIGTRYATRLKEIEDKKARDIEKEEVKYSRRKLQLDDVDDQLRTRYDNISEKYEYLNKNYKIKKEDLDDKIKKEWQFIFNLPSYKKGTLFRESILVIIRVFLLFICGYIAHEFTENLNTNLLAGNVSVFKISIQYITLISVLFYILYQAVFSLLGGYIKRHKQNFKININNIFKDFNFLRLLFLLFIFLYLIYSAFLHIIIFLNASLYESFSFLTIHVTGLLAILVQYKSEKSHEEYLAIEKIRKNKNEMRELNKELIKFLNIEQNLSSSLEDNQVIMREEEDKFITEKSKIESNFILTKENINKAEHEEYEKVSIQIDQDYQNILELEGNITTLCKQFKINLEKVAAHIIKSYTEEANQYLSEAKFQKQFEVTIEVLSADHWDNDKRLIEESIDNLVVYINEKSNKSIFNIRTELEARYNNTEIHNFVKTLLIYE